MKLKDSNLNIKELQVIDLRSWFAGCAMQGLLAKFGPKSDKVGLAVVCFEIADEMIQKSKKAK